MAAGYRNAAVIFSIIAGQLMGRDAIGQCAISKIEIPGTRWFPVGIFRTGYLRFL